MSNPGDYDRAEWDRYRASLRAQEGIFEDYQGPDNPHAPSGTRLVTLTLRVRVEDDGSTHEARAEKLSHLGSLHAALHDAGMEVEGVEVSDG